MALPKYTEFPVKSPLLGLIRDLRPQDAPLGSWQAHNNFHVFDQRVRKYGGWYRIPDNEDSDTIDGDITYGFEWVVGDVRRFILGTTTSVYLVNLVTGLVTLIGNGFSGGRWQSAVINERLIMTNGLDRIQEVATNATTIADLVGDVALPDAARYILNNTNHLVLAGITEGGQYNGKRVRWSDIDDPETWVRTATNEPGFLDIDTGQLMGLANIGTLGFMAYSDTDIWRYNYEGLPFVYSKNRVVANIGLVAPYSLVAREDVHFFLGTNGFYRFDGNSTPQRIGKDKVDTFFFNDFDALIATEMFVFAHPVYPEIWWVYRDRSASWFSKMLTFNWEADVWAERTPFVQSMLAEATLSSGLVWEDADFTWDSPEAAVTWASLAGLGRAVVIGGGRQTCPEIVVEAFLADSQVGIAYSQTLSATGSAVPYTYMVGTGTLPDGLSIVDDQIVGTPTTEEEQTFTIIATDANGCESAPVEFTITITAEGGEGIIACPSDISGCPDTLTLHGTGMGLPGGDYTGTVVKQDPPSGWDDGAGATFGNANVTCAGEAHAGYWEVGWSDYVGWIPVTGSCPSGSCNMYLDGDTGNGVGGTMEIV